MDVRGVVRVLDAAATTMFSGGELDGSIVGAHPKPAIRDPR